MNKIEITFSIPEINNPTGLALALSSVYNNAIIQPKCYIINHSPESIVILDISYFLFLFSSKSNCILNKHNKDGMIGNDNLFNTIIDSFLLDKEITITYNNKTYNSIKSVMKDINK